MASSSVKTMAMVDFAFKFVLMKPCYELKSHHLLLSAISVTHAKITLHANIEVYCMRKAL